jgi:hypothetical protein
MDILSNSRGDSMAFRIEENVLSWLLDPKTPGVRYLALRDLLDLPVDDPDLAEARTKAHAEGPIADVLDGMTAEGYWEKPGPGYGPKYRSTVWAMILLASLGAQADADERVAQACRYLVDHALASGGHFSYNGAPGGTIDCLQGNLCWALAEMGYADPRLEAAYDWMARTVTGEGIAPLKDKKTEQRYYAYKCGPDFACGANGQKPCAWGAVKVMLAFGNAPAPYRTERIEGAIQRGVEFLLGTEPTQAAFPTANGEKPSGNWWKFGFPLYYVTDLLQLAEALVKLGYGQDARLTLTLDLIRSKQDEQGRWLQEYPYGSKTWSNFGRKDQPNPWVTLRALRVLKNADGASKNGVNSSIA